MAKERSDPASCRARGGSQAVTLLKDPHVPAQLFDPVPKKAKLEGGGEGPSEKYSALLGGVGEDERP